MHRNYFTLYHAAMELHQLLAGASIHHVCTGEKNEAVITFRLASGEYLHLVVVTNTLRLGIFTRKGAYARGRNSTNLMKATEGKKITKVSISSCDRVISILLDENERLLLQLFGPKPNLLLVRDNIILDAYQNKNKLAGKPSPPDCSGEGIMHILEKIALDRDLFLRRFEPGSTEGFAQALSAALPGFDRQLARELVRQAGTGSDPERLFDTFRTFFYEMLDPVARVFEKNSGEPCFTLLPEASDTCRTFGSLLEALSFYSISMLQYIRTREELNAFRSRLQQKLRTKQKELDAYDPVFLENIYREYETCGHLLMACAGLEEKGRRSVMVPNFFEPDTPEKSIELKEWLSVRQNAEAYFSKASKTRGKIASMKERHLVLEMDKAAIEKSLETMERIATPKEARRFLDDQGAAKPGTGMRDAGMKLPASRFRSARISDSAMLFIGKNAENNELLTFGFAKPDDIWLHARGTSGSHCVLKGSGMEHLDDIRKAASIAAWHSSSKHSELVPVIYTPKKYVRRSKKLAVGQVVVEREKVLFVRPTRETE